LGHALNVILRAALLVRGHDGFGFGAESMNAVSIMAKMLKVMGAPCWQLRPSYNTVGVDLEGDLNPRNTRGSRWDAGELEFAAEVVILCQRTLSSEWTVKSPLGITGGSAKSMVVVRKRK
jgi:hypothetical protein